MIRKHNMLSCRFHLATYGICMKIWEGKKESGKYRDIKANTLNGMNNRKWHHTNRLADE